MFTMSNTVRYRHWKSIRSPPSARSSTSLDKMRSARRSRIVSRFRRYSVIDSTVSFMSLLRTKRVLRAFVTVAICASCASLKPVKEQSVISDADVPSGITTSPGLGVDGTRVPNPSVATPSVITQPPSAAQDSYRTLSSLLLARSDLPSSWEEDTSVAGETDPAEGWLGLGACLRTPVPVLEVSGSSFSNEATLIAIVNTTASLFSSPSEAQASLVTLDDVRPGGVANTCFTRYVGESFSGDNGQAFLTEIKVVEDPIPGMPNRNIRMYIDITDGSDSASLVVQMSVHVQGSASLLLATTATYEALVAYQEQLNEVNFAVFSRLISAYATR